MASRNPSNSPSSHESPVSVYNKVTYKLRAGPSSLVVPLFLNGNLRNHRRRLRTAPFSSSERSTPEAPHVRDRPPRGSSRLGPRIIIRLADPAPASRASSTSNPPGCQNGDGHAGLHAWIARFNNLTDGVSSAVKVEGCQHRAVHFRDSLHR